MASIDITNKSEFNKLIKKTETLLIIEFVAQWCGPCQMIRPKIALLAAEETKVQFARVDVDKNEETSTLCDITCMPTYLFYINGQKVDEI